MTTTISMDKLKSIALENEAKTIYQMLKISSQLKDASSNIICSNGNTATFVVSGNTLTLTYESGDILTYTDPDPSQPLTPYLNIDSIT